MSKPTLKSKKYSKHHWHDAEDIVWSVRHWAARIGVAPPRITFRLMRRKWASISTAGRLTLNTQLLSLPKDLGEFVIVHELVHLLNPRHGNVFKGYMGAYLPDWEEREERLQAKSRVDRMKGDVVR